MFTLFLSRKIANIARHYARAIERLQCWYTASIRPSTIYTNAQEDQIEVAADTPALLEFYRAASPDVRVTTVGVAPTSARLELPHGAIPVSDLKFEVFIVNPPLPPDLKPVRGLAAAYPLDEGVMSHASVAAALRITDSDTNADAIDEERSGSFADPWLPTSVAYGNRSEALYQHCSRSTAPAASVNTSTGGVAEAFKTPGMVVKPPGSTMKKAHQCRCSNNHRTAEVTSIEATPEGPFARRAVANGTGPCDWPLASTQSPPG